MAKKATDKEFIFLFRGGADPAKMGPDQLQAMMNGWITWMAQLKKRGQLRRGEPLGDDGKVLSGRGGKSAKPFAEKRDSIGGYLLIRARNLGEASKIAKGCPIFERGGTVEVRPVIAM
jgi:hypothetical protein